MGLGSQALNLTLSLYTDGWFENFKNVIELGSQDIHADINEVACVVSALTKDKNIRSSSIQDPRDFYKALGFETYDCIDTDGRHNALVFDLNESLFEKGFDRKYDLVTNHGTTEHCFDQFHAFENIHNLCAKGGIMIHGLPFEGYLNHGFYNYQPNFFRNIASANNYNVIGIYINIDSSSGDITSYSDDLMKFLTITPVSTVGLFAVLQKTNDEEFRTPFDGHYTGPRKYEFQKTPKHFMPLDIETTMNQFVRTKTLVKIIVRRIGSKYFKK